MRRAGLGVGGCGVNVGIEMSCAMIENIFEVKWMCWGWSDLCTSMTMLVGVVDGARARWAQVMVW